MVTIHCYDNLSLQNLVKDLNFTKKIKGLTCKEKVIGPKRDTENQFTLIMKLIRLTLRYCLEIILKVSNIEIPKQGARTLTNKLDNSKNKYFQKDNIFLNG